MKLIPPGPAKIATLAMIVGTLVQFAFVAVTYVIALSEVWRFWGYGGDSHIDYSATTFWQFGALSIGCILLSAWAAISLKSISSRWEASARYSAWFLLVGAALLYALLATPALGIRPL